jgi:hypothetical protein
MLQTLKPALLILNLPKTKTPPRPKHGSHKNKPLQRRLFLRNVITSSQNIHTLDLRWKEMRQVVDEDAV